VGGKGVSRACRASWLCDRTFAREQHPGQQPRHGQAAPRQGGLPAPLLGSVRHRSSYKGKCYDYLYQSFIKRSCPSAYHGVTGGGRSTAPLINSALHGGEWSTLSPCHFTPREKKSGRYPLDRRLCGTRSRYGLLGGDKTSFSCGEQNHVPWSPRAQLVHYTH
jgi:hypothetical protein